MRDKDPHLTIPVLPASDGPALSLDLTLYGGGPKARWGWSEGQADPSSGLLKYST